jgi:hypothetical protein
MFGHYLSISLPEIIIVSVNCTILISLGLLLSIFPDQVQRHHLERRQNPGRLGRWMARHYPLYAMETRLVASRAYQVFLAFIGYLMLLMAGILAGYLVAYVQMI